MPDHTYKGEEDTSQKTNQTNKQDPLKYVPKFEMGKTGGRDQPSVTADGGPHVRNSGGGSDSTSYRTGQNRDGGSYAASQIKADTGEAGPHVRTSGDKALEQAGIRTGGTGEIKTRPSDGSGGAGYETKGVRTSGGKALDTAGIGQGEHQTVRMGGDNAADKHIRGTAPAGSGTGTSKSPGGSSVQNYQNEVISSLSGTSGKGRKTDSLAGVQFEGKSSDSSRIRTSSEKLKKEAGIISAAEARRIAANDGKSTVTGKGIVNADVKDDVIVSGKKERKIKDAGEKLAESNNLRHIKRYQRRMRHRKIRKAGEASIRISRGAITKAYGSMNDAFGEGQTDPSEVLASGAKSAVRTGTRTGIRTVGKSLSRIRRINQASRLRIRTMRDKRRIKKAAKETKQAAKTTVRTVRTVVKATIAVVKAAIMAVGALITAVIAAPVAVLLAILVMLLVLFMSLIPSWLAPFILDDTPKAAESTYEGLTLETYEQNGITWYEKHKNDDEDELREVFSSSGGSTGNLQGSDLAKMSNEECVEVLGRLFAQYAPLANHSICSAALAQKFIESGWPSDANGLMLEANNILGLKAGSWWTGPVVVKNTGEGYGAGAYTISAAFCKFDSIDECIKCYYEKFMNNGRYDNVKNCTDPGEYIRLLGADGYYTGDPASYSAGVVRIIDQYDMRRFDAMLGMGGSTSVDMPLTQYAINNIQTRLKAYENYLRTGEEADSYGIMGKNLLNLPVLKATYNGEEVTPPAHLLDFEADHTFTGFVWSEGMLPEDPESVTPIPEEEANAIIEQRKKAAEEDGSEEFEAVKILRETVRSVGFNVGGRTMSGSNNVSVVFKYEDPEGNEFYPGTGADIRYGESSFAKAILACMTVLNENEDIASNSPAEGFNNKEKYLSGLADMVDQAILSFGGCEVSYSVVSQDNKEYNWEDENGTTVYGHDANMTANVTIKLNTNPYDLAGACQANEGDKEQVIEYYGLPYDEFCETFNVILPKDKAYNVDYVQWMIDVVNDIAPNGDGYVGYEMGPNRTTIYTSGYMDEKKGFCECDCSSFTFYALYQAGLLEGESPTAPFTSGAVPGVLERYGWKNVIGSVNFATGAGLEEGDVIGKDGHVCVYIGDKGEGPQIVEASSDQGSAGTPSPGNQGSELRIKGLYNYGWSYVMRKS